jgi:tripartite-type tricarboxylate transporter receptor subunit TctC
MQRRALLAATCAMPLVLPRLSLAQPAEAARWPDRPVRLLNPFTPGSAVDIVARLVALDMSERLGRQVIVENRTGAAGIIGTEAAARAQPDGYTFLIGSPGSMAINPYLYRTLPYDSIRDFMPVSHLVSFPQVLVVHPAVPARNLPELIAHAKANPGRLNYASSGIGATNHLAMEMIRAEAGIELVHVPFRGGLVTVQSLAAGELQVAIEGILSLPGFIQAGTLRPIAVTSRARSAMLPDVPAVSETLPGFDAAAWVVVFAPRGTPPAIVERVSAEIRTSLNRPQVREKLEQQGATIFGTGPEEAADFHRAEMAKWKRAVEVSGAKAD